MSVSDFSNLARIFIDDAAIEDRDEDDEEEDDEGDGKALLPTSCIIC